MSEPDFLSSSRIAIIGLGLMGGSLALALRGRCQELLGCDRHPETLYLAEEIELVDRLSSDPAEILPSADVVVLATPVNSILKLIAELPHLHPGSAIVLDLGSTKARVVQAVENLPDRFDPLGGHPMCGKETIGLENAEAELYQEATFVYTPLERTSGKARSFADQLAQAIGSQPLWIDAVTHDQWSAATSHLPYLVAVALSVSTPTESTPLIGPGFRSTTRVAGTSSAIMLDVMSTNRENISERLHQFRLGIDKLEGYLSRGEFQALAALLDQGAARRQELISNPSSEDAE